MLMKKMLPKSLIVLSVVGLSGCENLTTGLSATNEPSLSVQAVCEAWRTSLRLPSVNSIPEDAVILGVDQPSDHALACPSLNRQ